MANHPQTQKMRGSEKLLSAWRNRTLTDAAVQEIGKTLDESPAQVLGVRVVGGASPTGLQVSLAYEGDDIPRCGNDISAWLQWLRQHGGVPKPPRILINGQPYPEVLKLVLNYGDVGQTLPVEIPSFEPRQFGGELGG